MQVNVWVKIPNLAIDKTNLIPLKISGKIFGEVQEIVTIYPDDQYEVRAYIYPSMEAEFLKLKADAMKTLTKK